jgi:hypothetical protein
MVYSSWPSPATNPTGWQSILLPAALASVPFGFVIAQVRVPQMAFVLANPSDQPNRVAKLLAARLKRRLRPKSIATPLLSSFNGYR